MLSGITAGSSSPTLGALPGSSHLRPPPYQGGWDRTGRLLQAKLFVTPSQRPPSPALPKYSALKAAKFA